MKKLTKAQKVKSVSESEDVINAVKILCGLYDDLKLKSFIRYTYNIDNREFELTFQQKHSEIYK